MGNCSSDDNQKPAGGGAAPEQGGQTRGGGFGAPVKERQQNQATGVCDMELYNSLPPCEMAGEIKSLHPVYGGRQEGIEILTRLYISLTCLKDYARTQPSFRFLKIVELHTDPHALKISQWAGFKTDVNDTTLLTAEESPGVFALKRNAQEFTVVLQYIEAMLGGIPTLPHVQEESPQQEAPLQEAPQQQESPQQEGAPEQEKAPEAVQPAEGV
eukprot:TRINITY_DN2813_c0_g1_i1.p1 TRINITY_DN2813_c0_g1~~TRINITY_DN2813_c0_g1_i1.p1  ORF type:complete len:234 (+),score=59.43 TRINITY_DN2813_c0_g1_i1:61-702(+)